MTKDKAQTVFTIIDKNIANNLKKYSIVKGFTIGDIARITGVSHQQATKYFKGTNRIPNSKLSKLCTYFNLNINDFISEDKEDEIVLTETALRDRNLIFKLIKNFKSLDDLELRLSIVAMIGNFARINSKIESQKEYTF